MIVTRRPRASAIWLAIVRFQIKSYSLNSSAESARRLGIRRKKKAIEEYRLAIAALS